MSPYRCKGSSSTYWAMATRACLSVPRKLFARRCFSSTRAAAADVTHAVGLSYHHCLSSPFLIATARTTPPLFNFFCQPVLFRY